MLPRPWLVRQAVDKTKPPPPPKKNCVQVSLPTLILGPTLKMKNFFNDFLCIEMIYRAHKIQENHHKWLKC